RSVILLLDEHGRNQHWREGGLAEQLAAQGRTVCAADIRGIGDLRPEVGRGAPGYTIPHNDEEEYAWASLILGVPLLGQRVTDILALVQAFASYGRIALVANGRLTVPALFAAALDDRIHTAYLSSGLVSLRSVVTTENYKCPLANIAPSLLTHTDLPQLAEQMTPRKIYLAGCVDGTGRKMEIDAVKKLYPYPNVAVSKEQEWIAEKLSLL
ncbi:MAG: lysophospholipase, partial [Acidobacteriota bacterium]|nr:lysophospholipase [Acidobacteriota bacterium]